MFDIANPKKIIPYNKGPVLEINILSRYYFGPKTFPDIAGKMENCPPSQPIIIAYQIKQRAFESETGARVAAIMILFDYII